MSEGDGKPVGGETAFGVSAFTASEELFVINSGSRTVTVLDAGSMEVARTVELPV